jgi:hypothetical protein
MVGELYSGWSVHGGWSVYGGWTVQWVKCLWWVNCTVGEVRYRRILCWCIEIALKRIDQGIFPPRLCFDSGSRRICHGRWGFLAKAYIRYVIPKVEDELIVGLELIVPGSSAPGQFSLVRAPIALLSSRVSYFASGSNKLFRDRPLLYVDSRVEPTLNSQLQKLPNPNPKSNWKIHPLFSTVVQFISIYKISIF